MKRRLAGLLFPGRRYWSSPCPAAWCLTSVWGSACELRWVCIPGGHEESRVAYHLTEKSVRGVESIMVWDIPVYRRIATSVTVWIQKRANLCSASLEPRNWLMVSNIPFGLYEPEWTDYLKTFSSIFGWNLTIYLPSGISEIFCQMVSTPGLTAIKEGAQHACSMPFCSEGAV